MKVDEVFHGKRVCLIGNAPSALKKKHPIDEYDVVCRCNTCIPRGESTFIGTRTDVIFTSISLPQATLDAFGPLYTLWCTPKHDNITEEFKQRIDDKLPLRYWMDLERELGFRPSTGCMALYWLVRDVAFKTLDIYGFDFWETGKPEYDTPHDAQAEKKYIEWLEQTNDCLTIVR